MAMRSPVTAVSTDMLGHPGLAPTRDLGQVRQMHPARGNIQILERDVVKDAVHQMIAAEGPGGVGNVRRHAGIAHRPDHGADRQRRR